MRIVDRHREFIRYLVFIAISLSTAQYVSAADPFDSHMSDMGMSTSAQQDRVRWTEIDIGLRQQLEAEYRSPEFEERAFFAKYVELMPAEAILDFLDTTETTCHRQAHELGRAIFRKERDINKTLQICGNSCTNACMHGAIGEAFSDDPIQGMAGAHGHEQKHPPAHHDHHAKPDIDRLIQKMEGFCYEDQMSDMHKRGNCAHAMGHALMLSTDHNIGDSLSACSRFKEEGMDYYCATGVYMQYADNSDANGSRPAEVERWGSNYPCNQHPAYPAACYRYIVTYVKEERGLGLDHLMVLCSQLPANEKMGCFHGLGAAYTPLVKARPDMLKAICAYGNEHDQALCIEGAIEKLADFDEEWAMKACQSLDKDNQQICEAAAKGKMYRLDKPTMKHYRVGMPSNQHQH